MSNTNTKPEAVVVVDADEREALLRAVGLLALTMISRAGTPGGKAAAAAFLDALAHPNTDIIIPDDLLLKGN